MSWAGTSRADFEHLADIRIKEARVLFAAGLLDGAYYLGGYALECALKVVIVEALPVETLVHHRQIQDYHTHDLASLMRHAYLLEALEEDRVAKPGLDASWTVVNRWSEQERHAHGVDADTVFEFLTSIDDESDGILPWVKQHW